MQDTLASFMHPELIRLHTGWQAGSVPGSEWPRFRDHAVLIEVAGTHYTYRHYGTAFVRAFGVDLSGLTIDYIPETILPVEQRLFLEFEYAWVHQNARPLWRAYSGRFGTQTQTWQRLVLPLDGERLLVGAYPMAPVTTPVAAGQEAYARLLEQVMAAVPLWLEPDGSVGGLVIRFQDLTESRNRARELEQLATVDFLTGVANRRAFEAIADHEIQRAHRHRLPLTVLALDLDHFKRFNDHYGHAGGDAVLQCFAEACRASLRREDTFARIGGEEFAALLPDTDEAAARVIAERLRRRVEALSPANCLQHKLPESVSQSPQPAPVPASAPAISVSIGIGCLRQDDDRFRLLTRADRALYGAKRLGRNTVVAALASED